MRSIGLYVFVIVFSIVVATCTFILVSWHIGMVSVFIAVALFMFQIRSDRDIRIPILVGAAIGIACVRVAFVPTNIPKPFEEFIHGKETLPGVVVRLPDERETQERLTIQIEKDGETTNIIAAVPLYPGIHVGDEVTVSGVLKKPEPFDTDGGRVFAYDQFLRKDGVFAVMQPAFGKVTGKSKNIWLCFLRILEYVKDFFAHLFSTILPEPERALAIGLILGGKQGLGSRLLDAFTKAGMLQIVVLSGYNVMIVANGIMRVLTPFPKRIAAGVATGSILCFVLAAGLGSSALRAAIMAFFTIAARTYNKQYAVMRALLLTLFLMVLWNPLTLVYDPGFQFSFLATLGLVVGSPIVYTWLTFIRVHAIRELAATTIAAQIGVLPLLLWQTGNVSIVSLFANMAVMSIIPLAMALSVLCALIAVPFALISTTLPVVIGVPAYTVLWYIVKVAEISAALPFSNVIISSFPFWVVCVAYTFISVVVVHERKKIQAQPLAAPVFSQTL